MSSWVHTFRMVLLKLVTAIGIAGTAMAEPDTHTERGRMVAEIEDMIAATAASSGVHRLDDRVRAALAEVPRHELVPAEERHAAYRNRPLPIGHGQTISQPFIVALMTELLGAKKTDTILEVGTGSGYQAAILSVLAGEVYTIELVPALGEMTKANLERLGYANVHTRIGDGYRGWPEHAPYDGIIVTAAPDHVPPALVAQLKPGGRMVIPVGGFEQDLMVVTKHGDGTTTSTNVVPVRFVPLIRK